MVSNLRSFLKMRHKRSVVAAAPLRENENGVAAALVGKKEKDNSRRKDDTAAKMPYKRLNEAQQQAPSPPLLMEGSRQRVVRFASEECNVFHENTEFCKEECRLFWCSKEDYKIFREEKAIETKQAQLLESRYASDPRSYANVMERVYLGFCEKQHRHLQHPCDGDDDDCWLSHVDANQFQFWIAHTLHHRLGLERSIVDMLGSDKYWRRSEMLETIYNIQENYCCCPYKKQESIRLACQAMSRPSRLFASRLGQVAAQCD